MLFFFKEKPITITAIVSNRHSFVEEFRPITLSNKVMPAWCNNISSNTFDWESMHATKNTTSNLNVNNMLARGFIMPMWCDLAISNTNEECKFLFADINSSMEKVDNDTSGYYKNYNILKLLSPWLLLCKENISFISSFPFYNVETPPEYIHLYSSHTSRNGVCDTNINIAVSKDNIANIMIKCDTPLTHFIPLTDRDIMLKTEVVTEKDYNYYRKLSTQNNLFM